MYEDEFAEDNSAPAIPPCWAAEISNDAAQAGDDVLVRIPGIDNGKSQFGPCRWSPQVADDGAIVYPEEGNDALVVKDDIGEYWILKWWVYG